MEDSEVVALFREVQAVTPNKQIIIYGLSVIKVGQTPEVAWHMWLGMYKSYCMGNSTKDEWFPQLRTILVHLFNEATVEYIDKVYPQGIEVWRDRNGQY